MSVKKEIVLARSLLYLLEVVRNGKMSVTAERNGIKPANLSQIIKNLEKMMGVKLLKRKSNGVEPTIQARQLLEWALKIEEGIGKSKLIVSPKSESSVVNLYISPDLSWEGIESFYDENRDVGVIVTEDVTRAQVSLLNVAPKNTDEKMIKELVFGQDIKQKIWVSYDLDNPEAEKLYKFLVASII